MSRWRLGTTAGFDRAARKLDHETLRRSMSYPDEVLDRVAPRDRGRDLTADLAGYWRHRIGDCRVIVEIREEALALVAVGLGDRSEIYRNG